MVTAIGRAPVVILIAINAAAAGFAGPGLRFAWAHLLWFFSFGPDLYRAVSMLANYNYACNSHKQPRV